MQVVLCGICWEVHEVFPLQASYADIVQSLQQRGLNYFQEGSLEYDSLQERGLEYDYFQERGLGYDSLQERGLEYDSLLEYEFSELGRDLDNFAAPAEWGQGKSRNFPVPGT
jgi:hypothetical protein